MDIKTMMVRAGMILMGLLVYAGLCLSAIRSVETKRVADDRGAAVYDSESPISSADEATGTAPRSAPGKPGRTETGDAEARLAYEVESASTEHETGDVDLDARPHKVLRIEQDCQDWETKASDDHEGEK